MRTLLFILSILFLTGCYTTVQFQYPIKQQRTQVTHLLAIDSKGDTVKVQPHDFRLLYNNNPRYYSDWRFYWRNNWITPYSYYRYYYRPYQPIYIYYPYPSWDTNTGNKKPEPKVNRPSQPRSSGVTRQEPKRDTQSTPRTTGRGGGESTQVQRSRTPQTSDSKTTGRSSGSASSQRKRDN